MKLSCNEGFQKRVEDATVMENGMGEHVTWLTHDTVSDSIEGTIEGTAFKPYVRTNHRMIGQHQYRLNETIGKVPSQCGKFSYKEKASSYSVLAVPSDSDISNTWYSTQHEAYTKSPLPKAIAPNTEQATSTSYCTGQPDSMEGSAFKPYVRSSDRTSSQQQYRLNKTMCEMPSQCGKFSYKEKATSYSVLAVPSDSDVSNTWYNTQHEAYTKSPLPKAIDPNAEQATSTSYCTGQPDSMEGGAFKPYVRSSDRTSSQQQHRLNKTICEVPSWSGKFSYKETSTICSFRAVSNNSDHYVSSMTKHDVYTNFGLPKAIDSVVEQATSTSCCTRHDVKPGSNTQKDGFAIESRNETLVPRNQKSQLLLWNNEANACSTGYHFTDANYQNFHLRVPEIPHIDKSPTQSTAGQDALLYNHEEIEASAFKPYVRTNNRMIGQHQYRLNETLGNHEVPPQCGNFSYEEKASNCSVRAVPSDSDVSNTWYSIQHEAYTKSALPKAIVPNVEQAASTSYCAGHDAKTDSSIQKDGFATESQNERIDRGTQRPKPVKANKKYPCDVCGRSFSHSSTLINHRRIHSGEKPCVCQLCGRAFRQPGSLSRHRLTHTTAKPYVCVYCNKAFNRASNLHTHMRTHTDYKPFACKFCGKRFRQKVDMKTHRYTHTGEKPHKCQKCGRGFKQLTHLTYHMRTHSEERMYHCPYCGKGFNQKGNMQAHIYRHTGERPFKCDTCGKGFTLASTLNTHKRTHAAQKPFQCEFCDKAFYQRNGLKTHYIASHPFSAGISLL